MNKRIMGEVGTTQIMFPTDEEVYDWLQENVKSEELSGLRKLATRYTLALPRLACFLRGCR